MKIDHFSLRKAIPEDVPLVYRLICELADYEKLIDEVVTDEKTLQKSLFEDSNGPEVWIAMECENAIGFVLFFHNFSTFLGRKGIYIEDLYVREAYRGKGYGERILKEICSLAKERNCGRVEWWVLDWNVRAINFYKKMDAQPMDEWTVFRLNEEAIDKMTTL